MQWYREPNGDYLVVSLQRYSTHPNEVEGRATNIEGMPESMAATMIADRFLDNCTPVNHVDVPKEWHKWGYN